MKRITTTRISQTWLASQIGPIVSAMSARWAVVGFLSGVGCFLAALLCFLAETYIATRLLNFRLLRER